MMDVTSMMAKRNDFTRVYRMRSYGNTIRMHTPYKGICRDIRLSAPYYYSGKCRRLLWSLAPNFVLIPYHHARPRQFPCCNVSCVGDYAYTS